MTTIPILIGDTYDVGRPLWGFGFANENGSAFNLAKCTVLTTYKSEYSDDPTDSDAHIKHHLVINSSGTVTSSNGLSLDGAAAQGKIKERFTSDETRELPPNVEVMGDVRLIDSNGEVFTFPLLENILPVQTVTNRD